MIVLGRLSVAIDSETDEATAFKIGRISWRSLALSHWVRLPSSSNVMPRSGDHVQDSFRLGLDLVLAHVVRAAGEQTPREPVPSLMPQSTSSRVIVSGRHLEREQRESRPAWRPFPRFSTRPRRSGCSLIRRALMALM